MKTFTVQLKKHEAAMMHSVREEHENITDIDFYGDEVQLYFENGDETSFKIREGEKLQVEKE